MITYLTHKEIDFIKYDRCIDLSLNGILYAYSWYLDMVSDDWDILVSDDYKTVMPLPKRKKFWIHYIYQPFFIQQLGIFSMFPVTADICQSFLNAIPKHFRIIDTNLNTFNAAADHGTLKAQSLPTYELDLSKPVIQLRSEYSSNTLRNINKAKKQDLFIARHGRPETIIETFRENRGSLLKSFSEKDYQVLTHLIYSGIHRGLVKIYSAYTRENNFCAGIIFYRSHNKVILLFSGSTAISRDNGAMFLLVDSFISDHAGQKLVLDFEGSSNKSLARFYSGFGSKECVFLQIRMNRLPIFLKPAFKLYDTYFRSKAFTT
jgi:hypothetical protein